VGIKIVGVKIVQCCGVTTKGSSVVSSNPDQPVSASPALWIGTHRTTALVFTPQTLKNFNSHNFNNHLILAYYIT